MPLHRRDFIRLLGVSLASLYLSRCRSPLAPTTTCYTAVPIPSGLPPQPRAVSLGRERLRLYWLRFEELAQKSGEASENKFGQELTGGHLSELNELVASGEISAPAADLVQEAYEAAVYHVWRSNAPITCYKPAMVNYAPHSAAVLVEQAQVLNQIAGGGTINPDTLAKAQAALEHDMAFYALSEEEVQTLYSQLSTDPASPPPSFEDLSLELTPEAREATQFLIDLLMGN